MRELQGAIIIGSAFQTLLGYTGLMSLLVRYDFGNFFLPVYWPLTHASLFHQAAFIIVD
jgi:hypothetical protein